MKRLCLLASILLALFISPVSARILYVPDQFPTIQAGIDSSSNGDTVLVAPGVYTPQNLVNVGNRSITLASNYLQSGDQADIENTVIRKAIQLGDSAEYSSTLLGFTIENIYGRSAIECLGSSPKITKNIIRNNAIRNFYPDGGGAILCKFGSPIIRDNWIYGNEVGQLPYGINGGGIYCRANALIINNVIMNNSANAYGGGIFCELSNPIIIGNVIVGNQHGGICLSSMCNAVIINNTFCYNSNTSGGAISSFGSDPELINNILWDDTASYLGDEIYVESGNLTASFNNIQGGWQGESNIDSEPRFRNIVTNDFHLMSIACGDSVDSPCIDAGNPWMTDSLLSCAWGLGTERSDMGAYGGGILSQVDIDEIIKNLPQVISLSQNYPNPFNAQTTISFDLPQTGLVSLSIYDITGRKVTSPLSSVMPAGAHKYIWDAKDFSSGIYFAKLEFDGRQSAIRMILLK